MSALPTLSTIPLDPAPPSSAPAPTSAASVSSAANDPPPSSSPPPPPPSSSPSPTSPSPTSSPQQPPTSTAPASSNPPDSASASASTGGSSSASASAPTSSTSTPTSSVAPVTSQFLSSSGPVVETLTTVVTPSASVSPTPANDSSSSSNSFWHNTGAVAGVFTVVGLVAVAILVALITNAVRRRRAQKFDRDVAEAAAEAAASSRSPFDDYSNSNGGSGGGGGGGGYGYSDNSHGTFHQPPMVPQNDAFGMSEMSRYDPYAAAGVAGLAAAGAVGAADVENSRMRKDTMPGAPGIAGVGAGTLGREPSRRDPYHAFAGPGPQPHEMMDTSPYGRGTTNQDVIEAAGLAGGAGVADNGAFITRRPSEYTQHTHHSVRSQGYGSPPPPENYPVQYGYHPQQQQQQQQLEGYPQRSDTRSADPFATYYHPPTMAPIAQPLSSPGFPNPFDASSSSSPSPPGRHSDGAFGEHEMEAFHGEGAHGGDEHLVSYHHGYEDEDDEEEEEDGDHDHGNRVLRVANE